MGRFAGLREDNKVPETESKTKITLLRHWGLQLILATVAMETTQTRDEALICGIRFISAAGSLLVTGPPSQLRLPEM
jgi:hypothetical protein